LKYLVPIQPSKATGLVAEVYSQIKEDFGRIVEPFTLHSPKPLLLAGVWMAARESELVGQVPRETKEAIAASISKVNQCPYCVDAHTIMIRAAGERKNAKLIAQEKYDQIQPEQTKKIVKWALSSLSPKSELILSPPFEKRDRSEIIGTAVFYHYINPLVTLFLGNSPLPVPFFKNQMKTIASHIFKKAVNRSKIPGSSLTLLPQRKVTIDLSWTKESPNIYGAFSRLAGVISDIEKSVVPKQTVQIVEQYLKDWPKKKQEIGSNWINEITNKIDSQPNAATALALMTIVSPYKITYELISNFRKYFPRQNQLLEIPAWASFTRAIKIGISLIAS